MNAAMRCRMWVSGNNPFPAPARRHVRPICFSWWILYGDIVRRQAPALNFRVLRQFEKNRFHSS